MGIEAATSSIAPNSHNAAGSGRFRRVYSN
jgi:hypothetical protein